MFNLLETVQNLSKLLPINSIKAVDTQTVICYYKYMVIMITSNTIETGDIITPYINMKDGLKEHLKKLNKVLTM